MGYSCETGLIHVLDDVITALDKNQFSVRILLNFSKVFDTLNHVLIAVLHYMGFTDGAVELLSSYLTNRI